MRLPCVLLPVLHAGGFVVAPWVSQRHERMPVALSARGSGATASYRWVEGPEDVEVQLQLPSDTSARDVELDLHKERMALKLRGTDDAVIDGVLRGDIAVGSSYWTMEEDEDGSKMLYLRLEKLIGGGPDAWRGVFEGDVATVLRYDDQEEELDVDEYVSSIGGYDPEKVDKSMYTESLGDWKGTAVRQLGRRQRDAFRSGGGTDASGSGGGSGSSGSSDISLTAEMIEEMKSAGTLEDASDGPPEGELDFKFLREVDEDDEVITVDQDNEDDQRRS